MYCKYCRIPLEVFDSSAMKCPLCKQTFGYEQIYNEYNYQAFRESLDGYEEDPQYNEIVDMLWEKWYYSLPDEILYYDYLYTQYKLWIISELDCVEGRAWEGNPDCDYYAVRDKREDEIKQLLGSPYDYFLTLVNNDTEYFRDTLASERCKNDY